MKAVILAAGRGKRMMPLTKELPKPMVPIHGTPLLEYIISSLPKEIDELLIVTGYLEEKIKKHFGEMYKNKKIKYFTQTSMEGVWKALLLAKEDLVGEEKFLLIFADDLHGADGLEKLVKEKNAILANLHPEPRKFGVIEKDEDGYLVNIEEKPENPKTNFVATGVYVLDPKILSYKDPEQETNGEYYITKVFNEYIKTNKIKVVESSFWLPVGTPEDVISAHEKIDSLKD